jgi:molybdopterin-guanine dinucleotide biosynthesis protein A
MGKNSEEKGLYSHVTGIILAGGMSKRYGQNKAFLELDGIRLIDRVTATMKNIFRQVILITNEKDHYEYLGLPTIEDLIKGLGPIGGIYTGLMSISDQAGFFVACDMPFINSQLIRYMVDIKDNYAAVIPSGASGLDPLHAIYSRSCLDVTRSDSSTSKYQYDMLHKMKSGNSLPLRRLFSISTHLMNLPEFNTFLKLE